MSEYELNLLGKEDLPRGTVRPNAESYASLFRLATAGMMSIRSRLIQTSVSGRQSN
jgi:hypothetical protein